MNQRSVRIIINSKMLHKEIAKQVSQPLSQNLIYFHQNNIHSRVKANVHKACLGGRSASYMNLNFSH